MHSQKGDPSKFRAVRESKWRWHLQENSRYFVIPKRTYISNHSDSSPGFFPISNPPKCPTPKKLKKKKRMFFLYPSHGERVAVGQFSVGSKLYWFRKKTTRDPNNARDALGCPGVWSPQNAKKKCIKTRV